MTTSLPSVRVLTQVSISGFNPCSRLRAADVAGPALLDAVPPPHRDGALDVGGARCARLGGTGFRRDPHHASSRPRRPRATLLPGPPSSDDAPGRRSRVHPRLGDRRDCVGSPPPPALGRASATHRHRSRISIASIAASRTWIQVRRWDRSGVRNLHGSDATALRVPPWGSRTHHGLVARTRGSDSSNSELDAIPDQRFGRSRDRQGECADFIDVDHATTLPPQ